MRGIGGVVTLLVVVAIGLGVYKIYFSQMEATTGAAAPTQTIDIAGVQNDLIAIAQAERLYLAQNSSYASLDQLASSGVMSISKMGRDGYRYEVELRGDSYRALAHCPTASRPSCSDYAVDDTMQVQAVPK